jgi:hypothetical protein
MMVTSFVGCAPKAAALAHVGICDLTGRLAGAAVPLSTAAIYRRVHPAYDQPRAAGRQAYRDVLAAQEVPEGQEVLARS